MALEGIRECTRGAYRYRPRVVAISTVGIPRMPRFNQFVARCSAYRTVPPPCVVSIGMARGAYGSPVSFSLRAWSGGLERD